MIPPDYIKDWLLLIGALIPVATALLAGMRRWLINPLLKFAHEHEEQHSVLLYHLIANGDESLLPKDEHNISFRSLLIKTRLEQIKLTEALKAHVDGTEPLVKQHKQDLQERG